MTTFLQDLRHAGRSLVKTPLLTLAAILSLAIGIGANTTVFSWVQAILLRPIPGAADPDSIFVVDLDTREGRSRSWSYPNHRDVRDRATLVDLMAQDALPMSIAVSGQAERAYGGMVSGNYFQIMGVQPALGRLISPEDDRIPGGHPVVVLSHAYWQRRFASDPAIAGRDITVNNTPMTVIGVAQADFLGSFLGVAAGAWVPMSMQAQMTGANRLEARGPGWMETFARLRPGISRTQAQTEISSIMTVLGREYAENDGLRATLVRSWEADFGAPSALAPILGVLSGVVALVLLIACANVANLLLSRAVGRRREVAIRVSLGASRVRLVRQLLTEALLLSSVAGVLGIVIAYWTSGVLMAFAPPTDMPIDFGLRVDATTLGYAIVVSFVTGILFGLAPSLQASRPNVVHALKEEAGRGGTGGRTGHRFRAALVVVQVAVCVVLLVGAVLFVRSLTAAQDLDPGFDPHGTLLASIDLVPNGYTAETGRQLHRRLIDSITATPGVDTATFGRYVPLGLDGSSSMGISIDGYTPRPQEEVTIGYNIVGARYFETLRIPMVKGREFTPQDTPESQKVMIVNETMAQRYWGERDAHGRRVRIGKEDYTVIGVARDIKYRQIAEAPRSFMYLPLEQNFTSAVVLHVRSAGATSAVLGSIREAIRALDPNLPIFDARSFDEHMRIAVFAQAMGANMLGVMGALALLLAAVGLYGVIAYAVSQRTQEMGVRLALGAEPRHLLRMVVGHGLKLTAAGLAIGLILAFAATGFMRALLPGIGPRDPVTFVLVPLTLLAIAFVAAWIPARRAGRVDPMVALRYE